jgi:hypothetical protein
MGHMLEYPPGPRDQQLIQLVPPTLPLQIRYVLLLVNMKNSRAADQQLIQLVPTTLPFQIGYGSSRKNEKP